MKSRILKNLGAYIFQDGLSIFSADGSVEPELLLQLLSLVREASSAGGRQSRRKWLCKSWAVLLIIASFADNGIYVIENQKIIIFVYQKVFDLD